MSDDENREVQTDEEAEETTDGLVPPQEPLRVDEPTSKFDMFGDDDHGTDIAIRDPDDMSQVKPKDEVEYDVPEDATCEVVIKYGDRAGEVCGFKAKAKVNGEYCCGNHLAHILKSSVPDVPASTVRPGRIIQFGLKRACKHCFGFKADVCPYGSEDRKVCYFEAGKFRPVDVSIDDINDLTTLLEGLLNDDLSRLQRASLMEFFEGGLLDGAVDNLKKKVIDQAQNIARLKGVLRSQQVAEAVSGAKVEKQTNIFSSIFQNMPGASGMEEAIDAEYEDEGEPTGIPSAEEQYDDE